MSARVAAWTVMVRGAHPTLSVVRIAHRLPPIARMVGPGVACEARPAIRSGIAELLERMRLYNICVYLYSVCHTTMYCVCLYVDLICVCWPAIVSGPDLVKTM